MVNLKKFWQNTKRVFKLSRKPTLKELRMIIRICILGVVVIGMIGYGIQMMFQFLLIPLFNQLPRRALIDFIIYTIKLILI